MKRVALLFAIGVSCFLAGVIVTSLWFRGQIPPATGTNRETALGESRPDGNVSIPAAEGNSRAAKFDALDTDQDGKLSLAEFGVGRSPADATKWFGRRDADHDGFLSRQEFLPVSAKSETR
jgi:EF hand